MVCFSVVLGAFVADGLVLEARDEDEDTRFLRKFIAFEIGPTFRGVVFEAFRVCDRDSAVFCSESEAFFVRGTDSDVGLDAPDFESDHLETFDFVSDHFEKPDAESEDFDSSDCESGVSGLLVFDADDFEPTDFESDFLALKSDVL